MKTAMAGAQGRSRDEAERARTKLADLQSLLEMGWDNLTEEAARRLNEWLEQA